jgi:hypothetical protein
MKPDWRRACARRDSVESAEAPRKLAPSPRIPPAGCRAHRRRHCHTHPLPGARANRRACLLDRPDVRLAVLGIVRALSRFAMLGLLP